MAGAAGGQRRRRTLTVLLKQLLALLQEFCGLYNFGLPFL